LEVLASVTVALLVQHDIQQRSVDLKPAVVLNETQLPEFVHEEIHSRARGADYLRQRFLRYFGEYSVGLVVCAITGK
jgi:hypothetical protein